MDVKMFQHALKTWGDKMTQAEIDDVFNEFEIDEDYMVKTKEVVGLFVAVKEEGKKVRETPRRRKRRRRRLPSKRCIFISTCLDTSSMDVVIRSSNHSTSVLSAVLL